jgi:hypothetical protein
MTPFELPSGSLQSMPHCIIVLSCQLQHSSAFNDTQHYNDDRNN